MSTRPQFQLCVLFRLIKTITKFSEVIKYHQPVRASGGIEGLCVCFYAENETTLWCKHG